MKNSRITFAILAAGIILFLFWRFPFHTTIPLADTPSTSQPISESNKNIDSLNEARLDSKEETDRLGQYAGLSASELWKRKPKTFKTTTYPPQTPEEIDLWQWWRAISQADDKFQHKTPIEFYGKVVDQDNQPIVDARVDLVWSVTGGTDSRMVKSGKDGRFSIIGIQGKGISVDVFKEGYHVGIEGKGGFEYAAFFEDIFHVANPNNPVVFQLLKKGDSEPMYKWYPTADLTVDGKATWLDIKTGRIAATGDVSFSVLRDTGPDSRMSGYKLRVVAANGGGIALSEGEEFMFLAPSEGYQPSLEIVQKAGDPQFKVSQNLRFYLKTPDGKFAAIKADVAQFNIPAAGLQTLIYFNPSGSRNLEFDDKKHLKR